MARHIKLIEDDANKATDLYKMVLNGEAQGMTLDEMNSRLAIFEKMDKANGKLVLEDAEWTSLNNALKAFKWPQVHAFIPLACKEVADAEEKEAK